MPNIELRPYTDHDLPLLERSNSSDMTEHLGGPETREQLERRLKRYMAATTRQARMYKVIADGVPTGGVGFWERRWQGEQVYEAGWNVFPEFQGRGIAAEAMQLLIPIARAEGRHDWMHAFPGVDNGDLPQARFRAAGRGRVRVSARALGAQPRLASEPPLISLLG